MTDTSPEVEQRFCDIMLGRSGEDRLKMGCSMHAMAQAMVRVSGENTHKTSTPRALRRMMFLRFYGNDFDPETCEKILMSLENSHDD